MQLISPNGNWISGTMHNIYYIGAALELERFSIINNIMWNKTNPPLNITSRAFTHSPKTILRSRKQLAKKKCRKHSTQKPLSLLLRIIRASTNENVLVLDSFNGSGTAGIACAILNRKYIRIYNIEEYLKIIKK